MTALVDPFICSACDQSFNSSELTSYYDVNGARRECIPSHTITTTCAGGANGSRAAADPLMFCTTCHRDFTQQQANFRTTPGHHGFTLTAPVHYLPCEGRIEEHVKCLGTGQNLISHQGMDDA